MNDSDARLDARIDELEIRSAEQQQTIDELSEMIARQWQKIDELTTLAETMRGRIVTLEDSVAEDEGEPPPPHY